MACTSARQFLTCLLIMSIVADQSCSKALFGRNMKCLKYVPGSTANLRGIKTECHLVQEDTPRILLYPDQRVPGSPPIAVAFITEHSPETRIRKDNQTLDNCQSTVLLNLTQNTAWLKSPNMTNIVEKLNNTCFEKQLFADVTTKFPFKIVYRISYKKKTFSLRGGGQYVAKKHAYILPNKPSYLVYGSIDQIDEVCAKCSTVAGRVSKEYKASNITQLLSELL